MVLLPMGFLPGTLPDLWWIRHAPQVIAAIREGNQTASIGQINGLLRLNFLTDPAN